MVFTRRANKASKAKNDERATNKTPRPKTTTTQLNQAGNIKKKQTSTPRNQHRAPLAAAPAENKLTLQELRKINFGFDDDNDDDPTESMLLLSPVRAGCGPNMALQTNRLTLSPVESPYNVLCSSRNSTAPSVRSAFKKPLPSTSKVKKLISARKQPPPIDQEVPDEVASIFTDSHLANNIEPEPREAPKKKKHATKQQTIMEALQRSKKKEAQHRKRCAGAATARKEAIPSSSEPAAEPTDENAVPTEKKPKKTYAKRTRGISVPSVTSPVKKNSKQDRLYNNWATLQSSHFSEVDDFDLTFS